MDGAVLMCACEPGHVCSKCEGTPLDDRYGCDEPEPVENYGPGDET